ncbi:sporulation protein YunB [uncultured Intestinimonas sp.]|uniref:sporulation protein YunB n=1 Tax=uncultured Intestinimonas sp. TaxID=1689265 RepID=UPI0025ECCC2C|nr:sporulation protein YunB [uncultured Intestinimonas sp.]
MRAWYGRPFRRCRSCRKGRGLWLAGLLGVLLALGFIFSLELRLRPVVETMAKAKVSNAVTQLLDGAVTAEIQSRAITYSDLITVEKDDTGHITALTSNMAALNDLRTSILSDAVAAVDQIDDQNLSIPVGNLTGINFFSGRGFELPVDVMAVGSAHAVFQSRFSDAGINQTRHQILLEVTVSVDILLPGGDLPTEISAQVPVAETVIVGSVPDTYVELPNLQGGTES